MSDQMEEFLRRAVQRRAGKQPAEIEIIEPVVDAEIIEDEPAPRARRSDRRRPSARPSHPSEPVELAGEPSESRLRPRLGHRLGGADSHADSQAPQLRASAQLDAARISELLRSPQSVRNAIILSEVLKRPEHRWY